MTKPASTRTALRALSGSLFLFGLAACGDDAEAPTIESFTSSATEVAAGATVDLAWSTSNADQIVIRSSGGATVVDTGDASGTITSGPLQASTSFTLEATGEGGSATRTVNVSVRGADPTVDTFTASPEMITAGDAVTLTWATSGATSVDINTDGGAPIVGMGMPSGTTQVMPTADTTYRLVARNDADGSATAMVSVTVAAGPTAPSVTSFDAMPSTIDPGMSSTLSGPSPATRRSASPSPTWAA